MRVFVAGATGAIGRPLVASLLAAGREVTGSTRSAERAEGIRGMGAEAAYASALGVKPPRRVPLWLARLIAGGAAAALSTTLRGASNANPKRELGWRPHWSSWRQGFRDAPR
jgi:NAD(P)-dependent dehydrogenase (short-subunit alcohol dehydrogenase family)